jgi:hypothetical protein
MPPLDNAAEYENHIPEAVRRASARADELARGQVGDPAEAAGGEGDPPAEPSLEPENVSRETPSAEAPAPTIDWEQRYRTLQGKYDSEIPRLTSDVNQLRSLLASLQAPPAAEPSPKTTTTVVVPPEDISEYGEDLVAAARRWARAEVQGELATIYNRLDQLQGGQQRVETQTTQQRIDAGLSLIPELAGGVWQQLNNDPGFLSWLNQVDDFAGQPRLALLRDAAGSGDVDRTARFFKAYLKEHTAPGPTAAPAPVQTPRPAEAANQLSLESLAAPSRAAGTAGTGGAPNEQRVWTTTEITRFYDDVRRGKFAGRDDELRRTEQEIISAASEGRVQR